MQTLFIMRSRHILFILLSLIITGCISFNSDHKNKLPPPPDPYSKSGVNTLLAFGANMANMSEASQSELCKSLLESQQTAPSDSVQLRLMVGRLLTGSCGDIPKILEDIDAIKPHYISDENLLRFITLNTQVLTHMHTQAVKLDNIEHDQQKVKSILNSKGEKKKETRLLREKLEAIRSMEKQLDESSNNN